MYPAFFDATVPLDTFVIETLKNTSRNVANPEADVEPPRKS